ncbi:hypothetical protein F5Y00DRAFT_231174 [Daldinia vernicosa]|uniref:uncharacterized protein n=1 Tax=Daldinia vernicosa TaxID=114800 RepID=UPI002008B739|nr:uncharacterized protein F5Y00DRAFT_231174 [Daldinia vernicosa]KAI0850923.1 hypothetical protein F5Y00DRAFT_231174 [Daldinia vernicosa]
MTAASVPRIRTRKPKVRSGCATCKSRRIKCDEGRPTCARCQKTRLPCKYDYDQSRTQDGFLPVSNSSDAGSQIAPGVRSHDFEGHEVFYFDLFRNVVVHNLSQNGYKNFWTRTVLRESLRDECVRDCVLGSGALCRAMMDQIHRLKQPGAKFLWMVPTDAINPINTRYHRDALQFYTTAISKFRRRILLEGSSITPRTILIISILFIVFEAMQGNTETIDRLMHSAILALESSLSGSMTFGSRLPPTLDDEGVREADYFLARLSGFNSLLSPFYPAILRNKAYQRTWLCRDAIPSSDQSTQQIEHNFERHTTYMLFWCFRTVQTKLFNNPTDFMKFQEEQTLAIDQSEIWCEFLESKVEQEKDPVRCWSWKIMLVEAKMFNIYAHYRHDPEECEAMWDSQLPICREVIALAESVLQEGSPLTGTLPPLFEDKLQPMLRSLTCKCRNYNIRSRALALCQKLSGPWFENKAMVVGMKILIELEEQQRDASGFIPYRSRLRWSISSWNDDRTELRMVLTGVVFTGHRKELTIRKDESIDDMIANISKQVSSQ